MERDHGQGSSEAPAHLEHQERDQGSRGHAAQYANAGPSAGPALLRPSVPRLPTIFLSPQRKAH
jgi:hypothetical protein